MATPSKAKRSGRYTSPEAQGRITAAPVHTTHEQSPAWYGWFLIDLIVFGLMVIALNYLQVLPGSTSPWYLVLGLVSLFSAFYAATRYH
jgi:FtsH-binding integral membrane protein